MPEPRAPIVFCCSSRTGLGHVRRLSLVAAETCTSPAAGPLVLLTNAAVPERLRRPFDASVVVDRSSMAEAATARRPACIVVDTARVPGIERVRARRVLVLREVKSETIEDFQLVSDGSWDLIVVPNPEDAWTPPARLRARRLVHAGWIGEPFRVSAPSAPSRRNTPARVLVSGGGGGGDAGRLFDARVRGVLRGLASSGVPMETTWVRGPHAHGDVPEGVRAVAYIDDLPGALANADLAITAAGYNTVLELAALDVPALLVPIPRTYDDQAARARRWGTQLGHVLETESAAIAWSVGVLACRERRECMPPASDGARVAAGAIVMPAASSTFAKSYARDPAAGIRAASRSAILAARSVSTPAGTYDLRSQAVIMPDVRGENGREAVARAHAGGADTRDAFVRRLVQPLVRLHDASPDGLGLAPFDPWLKTRPRLAKVSTPVAERAQRVMAALEAPLGARIQTVIVHGDFHVGQLILDATSAVLLDVDDLALGPAEADLGNCAAHLATALEGDPRAILSAWLESLAGAYEAVSCSRVDLGLVRAQAAAALVRRALKLHIGAEDTARSGRALDAAADLAMTSAPVYQPEPGGHY